MALKFEYNKEARTAMVCGIDESDTAFWARLFGK